MRQTAPIRGRMEQKEFLSRPSNKGGYLTQHTCFEYVIDINCFTMLVKNIALGWRFEAEKTKLKPRIEFFILF